MIMAADLRIVSEFDKTAKQREAIALLLSDAQNILLYGGSRSGKTMLLLYAMVIRAMHEKSRHLVLRLHFNHAKTSIWMDTLPAVIDLAMPGYPLLNWNKTDYVLEFKKNGSEIWIGGLDDKERTEKVLGTQYSTLFFNECSQLSFASVETAMTRLAENSGLALKAYFDENPPRMKHWTHQLFIDKKSPVDGGPLPNPEDYVSLLMNPDDNRENLPAGYIENVLGRLSKRQRDRFLLGLWGSDTEGALWRQEWILRRAIPEAQGRIVIGVDPATTRTATSDETGIIVAARVGDWLLVLEDLSGKYTDHEWGYMVCDAYRRWGADTVVGEVNNGGDLVGSNIRLHNRLIHYHDVHASRGKWKRAGPIAGLYERGLGFHCGEFPELEDQMTGWVPPKQGETDRESPDRMDALVWAATELFIEEIREEAIITHDDYQDISRY